MNKIVCLLGKSAAGKDTIIKLLRYYYPSLNFIVSHTTRPKRSSETEGVEYYFIGDSKMKLMILNNEMIEHREYKTIQNGNQTKWLYGLSKKEVDTKLNDNHCLTCVDMKGLNDLIYYIGEENIIPIYIDSYYSDRKLRAIGRDKNFEIKEFQRRNEDDNQIFKGIYNDKKIYKVLNLDLTYCFLEICKILKNEKIIDEIKGL